MKPAARARRSGRSDPGTLSPAAVRPAQMARNGSSHSLLVAAPRIAAQRRRLATAFGPVLQPRPPGGSSGTGLRSARSRFRTEDGKDHAVYFEDTGGARQLVVNPSPKQTVESFLTAAALGFSLDGDKKGQALIAEARSILPLLEDTASKDEEEESEDESLDKLRKLALTVKWPTESTTPEKKERETGEKPRTEGHGEKAEEESEEEFQETSGRSDQQKRRAVRKELTRLARLLEKIMKRADRKIEPLTGWFTEGPKGNIPAKLYDRAFGYDTKGKYFGLSFTVRGIFVPKKLAKRGEYRQDVYGTYKENGVPQTHTLYNGVPLSPTEFNEDGKGGNRYGHRSEGHPSSVFKGAGFYIHDSPGTRVTPGTTYDIDLKFRGQLVELKKVGSDSVKRVIAERLWTVSGSYSADETTEKSSDTTTSEKTESKESAETEGF